MLPHCDELFLKYFEPWYDEADRARRSFATTRPDMMGITVKLDAILAPEWEKESARRVETMFRAARNDWASELGLSGEVDLSWVDAVDRHYDSERIKGILSESDPGDFCNTYLIVCCEFGALLGHVLQALQPRLQWRYDWPYWESDLRDPEANQVIPPFHWAIKKMSGYGVDDGFAEKLQVCVGMLEERRKEGQ